MRSEEVSKDVFWIGERDAQKFLQENCFLIKRNGKAIMIDPHPLSQFHDALRTMLALVAIEDIDYIIIHHQDLGIGSSLKAWEDAGFQGHYVANWRTALFLPGLNIKQPVISVPQGKQKLEWQELDLRFISIPYLHAPGAMMTCFETERILFSSNIFSSFGYVKNRLWYALEDFQKVSVFHQYSMPSMNILRPVLDEIRRLDVRYVFPRHGLLYREHINQTMEKLRTISCGGLLQLGTEKSFSRKKLNYTAVLLDYLSKIRDLLDSDEQDDFQKKFCFDKATAETLKDLEKYIYTIEEYFRSKGKEAYIVMLPVFLAELMQEYQISTFLPQIFPHENTSDILGKLVKKSVSLESEKYNLLESIIRANDESYTDKLTGFYNEQFFSQYLESVKGDGSCLFIRFDDLNAYNAKLGYSEGDKAIKALAQILLNMQISGAQLFRMTGPVFLCYKPAADKTSAIALADKIRSSVKESKLFLQAATVSVAVVEIAEIRSAEKTMKSLALQLLDIGKKRLAMLDKMGKDSVSSSSDLPVFFDVEGRILLLYEDSFEEEMIREILEGANFETITVKRGSDALKSIKLYKPNLVISALHLPQMDAFQIRQQMLNNSEFQRIPMMVTAYQKTEADMLRAQSLSILHYLKKPYFLSELVGIASKLVEAHKKDSYGV